MAKECSTCHRTFHDKLSHCPIDGALLVRSQEPSEDPHLNEILAGKYRIDARLGEGGICNVYQATILDTNEICAIKLLKPGLADDESTMTRFKQEMKTVHTVVHPNIVKVIDAYEEPLFMAMELLAGVTLKQEIQRIGPFSVERTCKIVRQLCDALDAVHAKGIVHRDLKPDNVMLLKRAGELDVVKLFDFGIAKTEVDTSGDLLHSNIVLGTPRYMSPEQCQGHTLDTRSDIYSLGIIVYEMLSGVPPFIDTSARTLLSKHTLEPVPSLKQRRPALPTTIERVVLHALEKSPLRRPQTVHEFAEELDNAVNLDPSLAPEHVQAPPSPPVIKSNLVPVVKQVRGSISIVEYTVKNDKEEKEKEKLNPLFSPDQIKGNIKQNWPYWMIGLFGVLALIVLVLLIIVLTK